MKRIISFVLIFCLAFSLFGCSVDTTDSDESKTGEPWGFATKPGQTPTPVPAPIPTPIPAAFFQDPEPESVVATKKWGNIAVNQMAVVFKDGVERNAAADVIKQTGGKVVGELDIINLYQLEITSSTEAELSAAMGKVRSLPGVELVFPNAQIYGTFEGTPCSPLNDPVFATPANAEHYQLIGMENAWRIIKGSGVALNQVNVGVLDSAISNSSDEFGGKVKLTGDKTNQTERDAKGNIINSGLTHGTLVTQIIGANPDNTGMAGIASILGDKLNINVKNLHDGKKSQQTEQDGEDITKSVYNGTAYTVKSLAYLKEQVDRGATVINCSYGPQDLSEDNAEVCAAYKKFFEYYNKKKPGVLFIASAGNNGDASLKEGGLTGTNHFPGGIDAPNLMTVGTINNDGSRADFSNFAGSMHARVHIAAPGVDMVAGVDANGQPIKASGTSLSAPQVTAAVALIQSIHPALNATEIRQLLMDTAAKNVTANGKTNKVSPILGQGLLKVDEAVLKVINDLRAKQKPALAPYTMQQLLDMSAVHLTAAGGPKDFTLTALIPNAKSGSTSVKIEVTGTHSMTGETTQSVTAGGSAVWQITVQNDPVFVRVVRSDTGTCAYMTIDAVLKNADLAGTWWCKGVLHLKENDADVGAEIILTPNGDTGGTVQDVGKGKVFGYTLTGNRISWSEGKHGDEKIYDEFLWAITLTKAGGTITGEGLMTFVIHADKLGESRYQGTCTMLRPPQ